MKIEVGGVYRSREGERVQICRNDGSYTYPFESHDGSWYAPNGVYDVNTTESQYDLIALWDEPAAPAEGVKADIGKLPWALLPFDAVRGIVEVLRFGAAKYTPRNWELGMDWSRCFDACLRHLTAWWQGEAKDPETGFSHLWHAGCCILFLAAYEIRGIGKDDRPTPNSD